ncbi:MAG: hypothetical protein JWR59_963 [Brevundimonas sp.]|nr:hypothetical protein [Brevundimonas sp.]
MKNWDRLADFMIMSGLTLTMNLLRLMHFGAIRAELVVRPQAVPGPHSSGGKLS